MESKQAGKMTGLVILNKAKQTLCVSIKKSILTGCCLHSV